MKSELRALEKLSAQQAEAAEAAKVAAEERERGEGDVDDGEARETEVRTLHALRSSNLPFYIAVWTVTKRSCRGLMAFGKRFHWEDTKRIGRNDEVAEDLRGLQVSEGQEREKRAAAGAARKKRSVLVDIVADSGEEWVKVSTITESRLLFEMAKKGWEVGWDSGSETEDDDGEGGEKRTILQNYDSDDSDDEDYIELLKLALDMKKAAREVRVRYRHPRIRFVLPKIVEGKIPEVDKILNEIRRTGVKVECGIKDEDGNIYEATGEADSEATLEKVFARIFPNPFTHFTSTLNVDCTLLLALVSDVSHLTGIQPTPDHHRAIIRQIEMEANEPLVPCEIWPALGNRDLVSSQEAVKRMHDIVDTIGTESEKARTELLMGVGIGKGQNRETLIQRFQELSDHKVPGDWNIPITEVDVHPEIDEACKNGKLPKVSHKVAEEISTLNQSVFLYGWAKGIVTVSSNRTVAKQVEAVVEANRDGDDELVGPDVWLCDTARSLIGKEKNRKG